jgi:hypothetical protein
VARVTDPEVKYDLPTFTQHLRNLEVKEKGTAVLECRVEPAKDPTMKIGRITNSKTTLTVILLFYVRASLIL